MVYVGKNSGTAALIYCIFTGNIPEIAFDRLEGLPAAKLPTKYTEEMIALALDGVSLKEIGEIYNIDYSVVSYRIKNYLGMTISEYRKLKER